MKLTSGQLEITHQIERSVSRSEDGAVKKRFGKSLRLANLFFIYTL